MLNFLSSFNNALDNVTYLEYPHSLVQGKNSSGSAMILNKYKQTILQKSTYFNCIYIPFFSFKNLKFFP